MIAEVETQEAIDASAAQAEFLSSKPIYELFPSVEQFTTEQVSERLRTAFLYKNLEQPNLELHGEPTAQSPNELLITETSDGHQLLVRLNSSLQSLDIRSALIAASNVNLAIDPSLLAHPAIEILADTSDGREDTRPQPWLIDLLADGQSIQETDWGLMFWQRDPDEPAVVTGHAFPSIVLETTYGATETKGHERVTTETTMVLTKREKSSSSDESDQQTDGDNNDSGENQHSEPTSNPAAELQPGDERMTSAESSVDEYELVLKRGDDGEPQLFIFDRYDKVYKPFHFAGGEQEKAAVIAQLLNDGKYLSEANEPDRPYRKTEMTRVGSIDVLDQPDGKIIVKLVATMGLKKEEELIVEVVTEQSSSDDDEPAGETLAEEEVTKTPEIKRREYTLYLKYGSDGNPELYTMSGQPFRWNGTFEGQRESVIEALMANGHFATGNEKRKNEFNRQGMVEDAHRSEGMAVGLIVTKFLVPEEQITRLTEETSNGDSDEPCDSHTSETDSVIGQSLAEDSSQTDTDAESIDHELTQSENVESSSDDDISDSESEPSQSENTDFSTDQDATSDATDVDYPNAIVIPDLIRNPDMKPGQIFRQAQVVKNGSDASFVASSSVIGSPGDRAILGALPLRYGLPEISPNPMPTGPSRLGSRSEADRQASLPKEGYTGASSFGERARPELDSGRIEEDFATIARQHLRGDQAIHLRGVDEPAPTNPLIPLPEKPKRPPTPNDHLVPDVHLSSDVTDTINTYVDSMPVSTGETASLSQRNTQEVKTVDSTTVRVIEEFKTQSVQSEHSTQTTSEKSATVQKTTQQHSVAAQEQRNTHTAAEVRQTTAVQTETKLREKTRSNATVKAAGHVVSRPVARVETVQREREATNVTKKNIAQSTVVHTSKSISAVAQHRTKETAQKNQSPPEEARTTTKVSNVTQSSRQIVQTTINAAATVSRRQVERAATTTHATNQRSSRVAEAAQRKEIQLQTRSLSTEQRQRREAQARQQPAKEAELPFATRDTAKAVIQAVLERKQLRSIHDGTTIGLEPEYPSVGRISPSNIRSLERIVDELAFQPVTAVVHDSQVVFRLRSASIETTQQFTKVAQQSGGHLAEREFTLPLAA